MGVKRGRLARHTFEGREERKKEAKEKRKKEKEKKRKERKVHSWRPIVAWDRPQPLGLHAQREKNERMVE